MESLVDAFERADVGSPVGLLTEDATWAMPPLASWYRGPAAIGEFLASFAFNESWRHRPSTANGPLALGCYTVDPATGAWVASGGVRNTTIRSPGLAAYGAPTPSAHDTVSTPARPSASATASVSPVRTASQPILYPNPADTLIAPASERPAACPGRALPGSRLFAARDLSVTE